MDKLNIDIRIDETIKQNKEMLSLIETYQEKISKYNIEIEKIDYEDERKF